MGLSIKCTRSVALLAFVVILMLEGSTADSPQEALHKEVHITEFSRFELGRILLEGNNASRNLAATVRVDPLDKLRKYRGGYNISNKHYWSSTAFTGKYGYGVAALWLLAGVIYAGFLLISLCCANKKWRKLERSTCSKQCYLRPIILGVFFAFLAIIASGVVLGGNSRFHSRARTVRNIIIDTAEDASKAIYNVTGAIKSMQDSAGIQDSTGLLNSTTRRLNRGAADIERQARKNKRWVDKGLKIMYATTTVVVSLNLIAILALSVSGFLRARRALYLFIILCWFFTVLYWLYFGAYFFIEKFAGDTCTALVQYKEDPLKSSLSFLPCNDLLSAKPVLLDAKEGIYDFINQINANISATPILNQVRICNPFSGQPDYNYEPGKCSSNTIQIGDIPTLLERFACSGDGNGTCLQGQFISASNYSTITTVTNSIQNLLNAIPSTERMVDCQMVKDAIDIILFKECKPVKKYIRMVWAAMIVLATMMVFLVLTWTTKAYHDGHNHFSDGSVKPQSTPNETLEPEMNNAGGKPTEAKLEI
ncbi:hypothetical protein AAC387_Pa05g0568 [Persea americana]